MIGKDGKRLVNDKQDQNFFKVCQKTYRWIALDQGFPMHPFFSEQKKSRQRQDSNLRTQAYKISSLAP